jgi:hypothetical protein
MMVVGQGTLILGISYLVPTSKIIVHISGSRGCTQRALGLYWFGQDIPTSSHWWHALPVPLMIKLIIGVTNGRERERVPSLFSW